MKNTRTNESANAKLTSADFFLSMMSLRKADGFVKPCKFMLSNIDGAKLIIIDPGFDEEGGSEGVGGGEGGGGWPRMSCTPGFPIGRVGLFNCRVGGKS